MKKTITALLAGLLVAGSALALDLEVGGEVKTGFFSVWREAKDETFARMYNNDGDSGDAEGRIRLAFSLQTENFGLRTRFYKSQFSAATSALDSNSRIPVDFAYAYGNLLDNQIKISAGLLGESPWGTGGNELLKELETAATGEHILGIRTEWKPNFSYLRGLNLGFVLNRDNDTPPSGAKEKFGDIFQETVAGIAYEHDFFAFRFAYRFNRELESPAAVVNGSQFVYRVEERILGKLLPGMSIWANGWCKGIGAKVINSQGATETFIRNWLYARYDPENFTAGIDIRYEDWFEDKDNQQFLELKPSFYYKLFNNFLSVGTMLGMEFGFNNGRYFKDGAAYNFWFIEPQVRTNINSNFYIAMLYRYTSGFYTGNPNFKEDQYTHWINIRLCYTF
jgi:hypothetical protein